jgi:hypothetical protein
MVKRILVFRITRFLNFVHRLVFYKLENITFRKLDMFSSSGEGGGGGDTNSPEDGNRSIFRNVVFSSL